MSEAVRNLLEEELEEELSESTDGENSEFEEEHAVHDPNDFGHLMQCEANCWTPAKNKPLSPNHWVNNRNRASRKLSQTEQEDQEMMRAFEATSSIHIDLSDRKVHIRVMNGKNTITVVSGKKVHVEVETTKPRRPKRKRSDVAGPSGVRQQRNLAVPADSDAESSSVGPPSTVPEEKSPRREDEEHSTSPEIFWEIPAEPNLELMQAVAPLFEDDWNGPKHFGVRLRVRKALNVLPWDTWLDVFDTFLDGQNEFPVEYFPWREVCKTFQELIKVQMERLEELTMMGRYFLIKGTNPHTGFQHEWWAIKDGNPLGILNGMVNTVNILPVPNPNFTTIRILRMSARPMFNKAAFSILAKLQNMTSLTLPATKRYNKELFRIFLQELPPILRTVRNVPDMSLGPTNQFLFYNTLVLPPLEERGEYMYSYTVEYESQPFTLKIQRYLLETLFLGIPTESALIASRGEYILHTEEFDFHRASNPNADTWRSFDAQIQSMREAFPGVESVRFDLRIPNDWMNWVEQEDDLPFIGEMDRRAVAAVHNILIMRMSTMEFQHDLEFTLIYSCACQPASKNDEFRDTARATLLEKFSDEVDGLKPGKGDTILETEITRLSPKVTYQFQIALAFRHEQMAVAQGQIHGVEILKTKINYFKDLDDQLEAFKHEAI
ncbi:hypothetical protein AAVH_12904 [Aphelenchoides avenae]|nr:hypothetical protein AAVH_12904 [Aphelenchus avenae]